MTAEAAEAIAQSKAVAYVFDPFWSFSQYGLEIVPWSPRWNEPMGLGVQKGDAELAARWVWWPLQQCLSLQCQAWMPPFCGIDLSYAGWLCCITF